MIKKLLLLILIFPFLFTSNLYARAEKKYLNSPLPHLYGRVTWPTIAACNWSTSHGTSWATVSDDDCDNSARTKIGTYNITDITCSDGAAGDCDGAFTRIRFSKLFAGTYKFFLSVTGAVTGACYWRITDGTNYSDRHREDGGSSNGFSSKGSTFELTYDVDQGETVFTLQTYDSASICYNLTPDDASAGGTMSLVVYYYPLTGINDTNVIFK